MTDKDAMKMISKHLESYRDSDFDESQLEGICLVLEGINEDFNDDTSTEDFALYNKCEEQLGEAESMFEAINKQESIEQELDERRYESFNRFH
jgi:hypothetical protein|tara:strand:+ start:4415 stop:4693 length:279 start_codon:yes stop_codon:yes gene_type:complete